MYQHKWLMNFKFEELDYMLTLMINVFDGLESGSRKFQSYISRRTVNIKHINAENHEKSYRQSI